MAKLRLFANLREIAGENQVEIDADTVAGVIESAVERFGSEFGRGVETARVWINGDQAEGTASVGPDDEVVLLPPVSGGSQPVPAVGVADFIGFVPLVLALLAFVANLQGQAVWGAFLVLAVAVWAVDLSAVFEARGREFAALPLALSGVGGVIAAHVVGSSGYGIAMVVAVAVTLGWAIAFPAYREVYAFSPMLLASLLGALGAASLVLARSDFSPDPRAVDVFLVSVVVALALGAVALRMSHIPLLDPFTVSALSAVIAAAAAAFFWDLDVVGYLLVGIIIAVCLVAGRGLASMLRLGRVGLTELSPGIMPSLEGVVLAAAIFYPLIRIVL